MTVNEQMETTTNIAALVRPKRPEKRSVKLERFEMRHIFFCLNGPTYLSVFDCPFVQSKFYILSHLV